VLGQELREGPDGLHAGCSRPRRAIRRRPRFVATKLARHFVADEPPPALVDAAGAVYLKTTAPGELYRELIHDEAA
jgi:uncharacterized protein (DUF1800 family)